VLVQLPPRQRPVPRPPPPLRPSPPQTPRCEGDVLATCCPIATATQPFPYCEVGGDAYAQADLTNWFRITDVKYDKDSKATTYQIGPKKVSLFLYYAFGVRCRSAGRPALRIVRCVAKAARHACLPVPCARRACLVPSAQRVPG
jgi:hypothetical protein